MNIFNLNSIAPLIEEPKTDDAFNEWIQQKEVIPFLEREVEETFVIIYASLPFAFIHSALVDQVDLDEKKIEDLLGWNGNPFDTWSLTASSDDVWISGPLDNIGSELLRKGRQILYVREFEGVPSREKYFELDQMISQVLDIHFLEERNAWCKLDDHGDIEDIVKVIEIEGLRREVLNIIVVFKKSALDEFACVGNYSLCRMFDFPRYDPNGFSGWNHIVERVDFTNGRNIFGRLGIEEKVESFSRGIQIASCDSVSKDLIIDKVWGRDVSGKPQQYASFITMDWKNGITAEISSAPDSLSNYFTESNLPFELSPAFFRPEVLLKYKSDREKYTLNGYSISCRGSWYLNSYSINDAGQVFAYLCDLNKLPYSEQLHWKTFNELPKAGLPQRTIDTDFLGRWPDEEDPLIRLRTLLSKLSKQDIGWWTLKGDNSLESLNYPYSNSTDEWEEEILKLDQVIIEGFNEKWLRKKAAELGILTDPSYRSLKLIEELLKGFGYEEDHAKSIMSPFREIHNLRSKLKGHTSGEEAALLRKNALIQFRSYHMHYRNVISECIESLKILKDAFSQVTS